MHAAKIQPNPNQNQAKSEIKSSQIQIKPKPKPKSKPDPKSNPNPNQNQNPEPNPEPKPIQNQIQIQDQGPRQLASEPGATEQRAPRPGPRVPVAPRELGRAERSGGRRPGTTKEVLGSIDFPDFKDFLGFPTLLLGFPRIS